MKIMTVSGPPSSGKTAVILQLHGAIQARYRLGVVKFDCLTDMDAAEYRRHGIPVQAGVSGSLCPDHFFAGNVGACMAWGERRGLDLLISESAGLCNRCAPHLRDAAAVCVIDLLSGLNAPLKIGPMLRLADIVVITKGDIVSQAEREVFALRTVRANPRAEIFFVNGLTGQGTPALAAAVERRLAAQPDGAKRLRFSMPGAVCSFCFGETQVGARYINGNSKQMKFTEEV